MVPKSSHPYTLTLARLVAVPAGSLEARAAAWSAALSVQVTLL